MKFSPFSFVSRKSNEVVGKSLSTPNILLGFAIVAAAALVRGIPALAMEVPNALGTIGFMLAYDIFVWVAASAAFIALSRALRGSAPKFTAALGTFGVINAVVLAYVVATATLLVFGVVPLLAINENVEAAGLAAASFSAAVWVLGYFIVVAVLGIYWLYLMHLAVSKSAKSTTAKNAAVFALEMLLLAAFGVLGGI